jgi:hypothetical protein
LWVLDDGLLNAQLMLGSRETTNIPSTPPNNELEFVLSAGTQELEDALNADSHVDYSFELPEMCFASEIQCSPVNGEETTSTSGKRTKRGNAAKLSAAAGRKRGGTQAVS